MINFHRGSSRMDLLRNFLVFSLCIVAANAEGKFCVLSSTSESLSFEGSSPLKSEEVGVVALASTGLFISDEGTWDGMYIKDPFDLPSVAVVVHFEDASEISFKSVQHAYSAEGNAASSALAHVIKAAKNITCDIHFTNHDDGDLAIDRCFSALITPEEPEEPENKPDEDKPEGEGDKPEGEGDKPEGEGDKPEGEGDKPEGEGDKPEGEGDKPEGEGDKPEGEGDKPGEEGESGAPEETRRRSGLSTKSGALKPDNEEDKIVLNAIAGINKMAEKAAALKPSVEFVFVRLSLAALKKAHESEQDAVNEAVASLETAVDNLQTKIIAAKGKKVVMFGIVTEIATDAASTTEAPDTKPTDEDGDETTAVTEPTDDMTTIAEDDTTVGEEDTPPAEDTRSGKKYNSQKTAERKKRSAGEGSGGEGGKPMYDHNLAVYYNEDYPVIFNIILWFMVTFGLSLLAICYAIGDMDPGRDSIIYRMTSTRMKKDN